MPVRVLQVTLAVTVAVLVAGLAPLPADARAKARACAGTFSAKGKPGGGFYRAIRTRGVRCKTGRRVVRRFARRYKERGTRRLRVSRFSCRGKLRRSRPKLVRVRCSKARGRSVVRARGARPKAGPAPTPAPAPLDNPLAGVTLFVDPESEAAKQAAAWRASRPADAALIDRIAQRPGSEWFGDWVKDMRAETNAYVSRAAAAGAVPVLVMYDIPGRDCGGHSSGGQQSAATYRARIREFAAGIGNRRAVVILEPDSLSLMDCLDAGGRASRLELLRDAVAVLGQLPGVATYVDAGHSGWHPPEVMAQRLAEAGVGPARGFALNVSNFQSTPDLEAYAAAIAARLPGEHAVLDTSRNGLGPLGKEWCNPPGRGLGAPPTATVGKPVVDGYLWIKHAGDSDGDCNGGPPAGTWWPEYAFGLASRAQ